MRLDIILEPDTPERFRDLGKLAESYGFGGVWTANIVTARDPFMNFLPLAADSANIRMGPVAISPFELHPVKIANQLFALNEACGGRGQIVIGGGGGALIAMGLKPGRRNMHPQMLAGVRECVTMLKAVGTDALLDYRGEVFGLSGYRPDWVGDNAPEIYVGASKPKMLGVAAEVADAVMLSDVTLDRMAETMAVIDSALAKAGRSRDSFRVSNLFSWHVKDTHEQARDEARRKLFVRGMLEHWYVSTFLDAQECALVESKLPVFAAAYAQNSPDFPGVPDQLVDKLVDNLTFTGTPADVEGFVAELKAFREAGLDEFAIRLYDNPEESIRLLGERVLPALV